MPGKPSTGPQGKKNEALKKGPQLASLPPHIKMKFNQVDANIKKTLTLAKGKAKVVAALKLIQKKIDGYKKLALKDKKQWKQIVYEIHLLNHRLTGIQTKLKNKPRLRVTNDSDFFNKFTEKQRLQFLSQVTKPNILHVKMAFKFKEYYASSTAMKTRIQTIMRKWLHSKSTGFVAKRYLNRLDFHHIYNQQKLTVLFKRNGNHKFVFLKKYADGVYRVTRTNAQHIKKGDTVSPAFIDGIGAQNRTTHVGHSLAPISSSQAAPSTSAQSQPGKRPPNKPGNRPAARPRISRRTRLANRFRSRTYPANPNLTGVATKNADGSYRMRRSARTLGQVIPTKYKEITINGTKYYRIGKEFFTNTVANGKNSKNLRRYILRGFKRGPRASDAAASFIERNRKRFLRGQRLVLGKATATAGTNPANRPTATPESLKLKQKIARIKKHAVSLVKKGLAGNGLNFSPDLIKKMKVTLVDTKARIKGKAPAQVVKPVIEFPGGYKMSLTNVSLYKTGKKTKQNPLGRILKFPSEMSGDVIARVKAHHETQQNKIFKNTTDAIALVEKALGIKLTIGNQRFARTGAHPAYNLSFKTNAGKTVTVNTSIFGGSADKPKLLARTAKELAEDIKSALGFSKERMNAEKNVMNPVIAALKHKYKIAKIDWNVVKTAMNSKTPYSIRISQIQMKDGSFFTRKFKENMYDDTGKSRTPAQSIKSLITKISKFIDRSDKIAAAYLKRDNPDLLSTADSKRFNLTRISRTVAATLSKRHYVGKLILKNGTKKNPAFGNVPLPHSVSATAFSINYAKNSGNIPGMISRMLPRVGKARGLYVEEPLKGISVDLYKKVKGKIVPKTIKEIQDELTKKVLASKEIKKYERPFEATKKMDIANTIKEVAKFNKTLAQGLETVFNNRNIRFDRIMYTKNHGIHLKLRIQMGNKTQILKFGGVFDKKWSQEQLGKNLINLSNIVDSTNGFIDTAKKMGAKIKLDHFKPLSDGVKFTIEKDGFTFSSTFTAKKVENISKKIDAESALMEKTMPTLINIMKQAKEQGGRVERLASSIKNGRYEITGALVFGDLELSFKVDFSKDGKFTFYVHNGVNNFVAAFTIDERRRMAIPKSLSTLDRSFSSAKSMKDIFKKLKALKKGSKLNVKGKGLMKGIRSRGFVSKSLKTAKKRPLETKRAAIKKQLDAIYNNPKFKKIHDNRAKATPEQKTLIRMYDAAYKLLDDASKIDATQKSWGNLAGQKRRLMAFASQYIAALKKKYKPTAPKVAPKKATPKKALKARGKGLKGLGKPKSGPTYGPHLKDTPTGHEALFKKTRGMSKKLAPFKKAVDAIRRKKADNKLMRSIVARYDSIANAILAVESIARFSSAGYIRFPQKKTDALLKKAQSDLKKMAAELKTYNTTLQVVVDKKPLDMRSKAQKQEDKARKTRPAHRSKRLINPFAKPAAKKAAPKKAVSQQPRTIVKAQKKLDAVYNDVAKKIKNKPNDQRTAWEIQVLKHYDAAKYALQSAKDFSAATTFMPNVPVIEMGMIATMNDNLKEIAILKKMPKNLREVAEFLKKTLGLSGAKLKISNAAITITYRGKKSKIDVEYFHFDGHPRSITMSRGLKNITLWFKKDGSFDSFTDKLTNKLSKKRVMYMLFHDMIPA